MKMVIVAPPGPNLRQPCLVRACFAAHRLLDRRIDKDPRHGRLVRNGFEQAVMLRRPGGIDLHPVSGDDIGRGHLVALGRTEPPVRHWSKLEIGIEADLMRSMPGQHRSASRLGDVADEQPGPACLGGQLLRQAL